MKIEKHISMQILKNILERKKKRETCAINFHLEFFLPFWNLNKDIRTKA